MKKSYGQAPGAFHGGDPVEQLRDHVWVSPYYEDDLVALRDGSGRSASCSAPTIPHAEGLATPASFVDDLDGFDDAEIRLIMRENARALVLSG